MSKNKHGDLFNTSLTEIIIILFFVLMLFALYNIDKVNKKNVELGSEVGILTNDVDILIDSVNALKEIIEADNEPSSLGPINVELTQQIVDLKKENHRLQKEIERLEPELTAEPETPEDILAPVDELSKAGNCIDKTFWRQCAEWAWPIASEPVYEYLFDIGMCSSGDIVVIKSAWKEKQAMDFDMVDGASKITSRKYIPKDKIADFISLIHDQSLDFQAGQTQHVARLVYLEQIYTDDSNDPRRNILDHMKTDDFSRGTNKFNEVRERFSEHDCSFFKTEAQEDTKIIPKPIQQESNTPIASTASFKFGGIQCMKAAGRTTPEFTMTVNHEITAEGRVKVKSYTYEKTHKNNRLVALDMKRSIEKQRKNIRPAMKNGEPVSSMTWRNYKIQANQCATR
jgi:hypothetical protein